ncbi:MAG TPA: caspase family protein [Blastocatellia bacterium]|nr:caspase family protein [Blastocatellia bacterium]
MRRNIYALLVGIDEYPQPTRSLLGCVNDIKAFQEYLNTRVESDEFRLRDRVLLNQEATYKAIIDGFESHLSRAKDRDVVVFYFSGHGSQEHCPEEFWHLEPDRMNETLVCYDSRPAGRDLADKELAKLIARIARRSPHIVVVLDCCHAGSGTRDGESFEGVRYVQPSNTVRPLENYIVSPEELDCLFLTGALPGARSASTEVQRANHVLLAACRDNEFAKEHRAEGGVARGAFSYFLLSTLQAFGGNLSYEYLMKSVRASLGRSVKNQTPQLEVAAPDELDQPFLGGAIIKRPVRFTANFDTEVGWTVDAGAIHGIQMNGGPGTTQFALFPAGASRLDRRNLSTASGIGEVTEVQPHLSRLRVEGIASEAETSVFDAVLVRAPIASVGVRMQGDAEGLRLARAAMESSNDLGGRSLYIREASEDATLLLSASDEKYVIRYPSAEKSLTSTVPGYTEANAALAVKRLEHIARWKTIRDLSNPLSTIPSGVIDVTAYSNRREISGHEVRLEYEYKDGKWVQPRMMLRLSNRGSEPLYCAVLMLSERFAIEPGFFPAGGVWLNKGEEAWSDPVYGRVPDRLVAQGVEQTRDFVKVIVSSDEFDARLLRQGELDTQFDRQAHRSVVAVNTLNCLMNRSMTRELSTGPAEDEVFADWCASAFVVTTMRTPVG